MNKYASGSREEYVTAVSFRETVNEKDGALDQDISSSLVDSVEPASAVGWGQGLGEDEPEFHSPGRYTWAQSER